MDTWELLRWSLGILTGDNHNSRYTRATVSLRPPVLSLPVPPLSARSSSTSSGLSSTLRPFAPRACAYVCLCLPLSLGLLSLLLRRVVLAPAIPRGPIILSRRPRLFRNCFQAFLLLLRLPLLRATSRASRYPRYFTGVSLSFSVFPAFSASSSIPLYRSPPRRAPRFGIYFSTYVAPTYLSSSRPPFILEMGTGIHETKLMITTSKQRAARPTATCPSHPYISLFVPLPPSHPYRTVLRCSMRTPRVSLRPVSPMLSRFSFFSAYSLSR